MVKNMGETEFSARRNFDKESFGLNLGDSEGRALNNQKSNKIKYGNSSRHASAPKWENPKLGLSRVSYILARLDNPQDKVAAIHIAGTNGKGSTSAFVTTILQSAGYKTGAFTSPHIMEFSDRIRINGRNLPKQSLELMKDKIAGIISEMDDIPTEFEVATAMAFTHFANEKCDFMVIEVGLGGLLDSTNVMIRPEICAITPVAIDHSDVLGSDLAQIAAQKTGIIKSDTTVVCGIQTKVAMDVIAQGAEKANCDIFYTNAEKLRVKDIKIHSDGRWLREFSYDCYTKLETSLLGTYQAENAATAIEIIRALQVRGWRIPDKAIRMGIQEATWPGRFEVILGNKNTPTYVLDGGHNAQGAWALVQSLNDVFHGKRIVFAMSVMKDKEYNDMLEALVPACTSLIAYEFNFPRVLDCEVLAENALEICTDIEVVTARNTQDAKIAAEALAEPDDVICVCGSLYALSDWYKLLR